MLSSMALVVAVPEARLACWMRRTKAENGMVTRSAIGNMASDTQISSGATVL